MQHNKVFRDYRHLARLFKDGPEFVAFDTETTGLYPDTGRVIEIGAVKFDATGILDTYNVLINPECSISPQISRISHIDDAMVVACPTIRTVLPVFLGFIGTSTLVAHNAGFDVGFMNAELARSSLKTLSNSVVDTLELSRWAYPTLTKHSLQFLARALSIEVRNAHRASDDARVCMEVFLHCLHDTASVQK